MLYKGLAIAVATAGVMIQACSAQPSINADTEAKRIAFCRTVIEVVNPSDRLCGPYMRYLRVSLRGGQDGPVAISSRAEDWSDAAIVARLPHGTKATRLRDTRVRQPASDPLPGTEVVRVLIRTDGPDSVTGWVHPIDIAP